LPDVKASILITLHDDPAPMARAIDSALMQQTRFEYEMVVDLNGWASAARDIVARVEAEHPRLIRVVPRNERSGSLIDAFQHCHGECVAVLDGEDYWSSPGKLQRQVEFLDDHPDYAMCFHNALVLDGEHGGARLFHPPDRPPRTDAASLLQPDVIPMSAAVYRNRLVPAFPECDPRDPTVAQWLLNALHAQHGKAGYLNEPMAVVNARRRSAAATEALATVTAERDKARRELSELRDIVGSQRAQLDAFTLHTRVMRGDDERRARMLLDTLSALQRDVAKLRAWSVSQRIREVTATLSDHGAILIVINGDLDLVKVPGRTVWPFPRAEDGGYAGRHSADSAEAIAHLESLRAQGARYLVFPADAFWWLQHYAELGSHLASHHAVIWSDERCMIYRLRKPAGAARERRRRLPAVSDGRDSDAADEGRKSA
jgi:hypothetical protein